MHIAQGILRTININKMIKAGFKFRMYVADWHAYLNNKLGGDLEKIQTTGKYFIEVWKACGMNVDHVEFVWASDLVKKDGYWDIVMRIATETSLKRILRTTQIMGRSEADDLSAAQILYPLMQAADIFMLNARVTQLGMDQRKVNMLARQVAEKVGYQ
jgi:tyrosyl-tRNA synthetase